MDWLHHKVRQFWQDLTLSELSGSLGDLGTFIPLLVSQTLDASQLVALCAFTPSPWCWCRLAW